MAESDTITLSFVLKAIDELSPMMATVGGRIESMSNVAKLAIGGIGLAAGAMAIGMVKAAEDLDVPMRKVYALTGISAEQFESYKKSVLSLSTVVPNTAKDLANGLYFVVSAGFSGADAMKVLEVSAKAATAGLTDTRTVADAVTSALNAYKLSGKDAGDITGKLTQAVIEGKTEYGALAGAIGRVLPLAAASKVSFDEVMSSLATMTRVGLNADEAATALRGILAELEKPTSKARDELNKLGLSADDLRSALRERGLLAVLKDLMDRTNGNVEALGAIFPNIRAFTGVLATAGSQAEQYAGILGRMKTANAGAVDEAFTKTMEGQSGQWALLRNNVMGIAIVMGDTLLPSLLKITTQVRDLASGFREWATANPAMAEMVAKGMALVGVIFTLAGGAAILGPAIGVVGTALTLLTGPIGIIAAAALGLYLAWTNNLFGIQDKVKAFVAAFYEMTDNLGALVGRIGAFFSGLGATVRGFFDFWIGAWATFSERPLYWVSFFITTAVRNFLEFTNAVLKTLGDFFTTLPGNVASWLGNVLSAIGTFATNGLQAIGIFTSKGGQAFVDWIGDVRKTVWDFFTALPAQMLQFGKDMIQGLINGIGSMFSALGSAISNVVNQIKDGIAGALKIQSPSGVFADFGVALMQGLAQGIMSSASLPVTALAGVSSSLNVSGGGRAAGSGSGLGGLSGTVQFVLPVYVNGKQVDQTSTSMPIESFIEAIRRSNRT